MSLYFKIFIICDVDVDHSDNLLGVGGFDSVYLSEWITDVS